MKSHKPCRACPRLKTGWTDGRIILNHKVTRHLLMFVQMKPDTLGLSSVPVAGTAWQKCQGHGLDFNETPKIINLLS